MNAITRTRAAWDMARLVWRSLGSNGRQPLASKESPYGWASFRQGKPQWQIVDFDSYAREGYAKNAIIFASIMYKVRAMITAPLVAARGVPDAPVLLPPTAPLSELTQRPNVWSTWYQFMSLMLVYWNIAGNAYYYVDRRPGRRTPVALWPMRPDRVYIVPSSGAAPDVGLEGFLYVPEGKTAWSRLSQQRREEALAKGDVFPMLPEDVGHIKIPNPLDPLEGLGYGMAPLSPLARSAQVDNDITSFIQDFFQRGGVPPFFFRYNVAMTPEKMAEVRETIKGKYGGWANWSRPGVLDNQATVERVGLTFQEMGFEGLDERNEARMTAPFGVPPILIGARLGLKHGTYSNFETARKLFWQDTMVPEAKLFQQELQTHLRGERDEFVYYDFASVPALQVDIPALVEAAKNLWSMAAPARVAFRSVGLTVEEYPGIDVPYVPAGVLPLGAPQPLIEAAGSRVHILKVPRIPELPAGIEEETPKALSVCASNAAASAD